MCNICKAPLVLAQLKKGPATSRKISETLGIPVMTVDNNLKKLKFERKVHIDSWCRPECSPKYAAVWTIGFAPDSKKPQFTEALKRAVRNETQRAYRAKMKEKDAERRNSMNIRQIAPQNPFSALGL